MMPDILKPRWLSSIQEIPSLTKADLSASTLTFWKDPSSPQHNSYGTYYLQLYSLNFSMNPLLIHPSPDIAYLPPNSLAYDSWPSTQMRELLSTEAPAHSPKPKQQNRLRTRPLLSELNLWPQSHFHLISQEQWSQTSVSGRGEPLSAVQDSYQQKNTSWLLLCQQERETEREKTKQNKKNPWTAGCPAKWAVECRFCLSVTQKKKKKKSVFGSGWQPH